MMSLTLTRAHFERVSEFIILLSILVLMLISTMPDTNHAEKEDRKEGVALSAPAVTKFLKLLLIPVVKTGN